ncbi:MAG: hypothetical protein ACWGPS_11685, partial [Candidatus Promineifilaceae bacterium]
MNYDDGLHWEPNIAVMAPRSPSGYTSAQLTNHPSGNENSVINVAPHEVLETTQRATKRLKKSMPCLLEMFECVLILRLFATADV